MGTIALVAFHVITTGTKSKDIGAAICVGFEGIVGFFGKSEEIKNGALTASDFSNNIVAP